MGYTHFWLYRPDTAWATLWPRVVADARRIVAAVENRGVCIRGGWGVGPPILDHEAIVLNGDAAAHQDVESFHLGAGPPSQQDPLAVRLFRERGVRAWFCKTNRQPYDVAVTSILLRAHLLAGSDAFVLSSDGSWADWLPARRLVRELFDVDATTSPLQPDLPGLAFLFGDEP